MKKYWSKWSKRAITLALCGATGGATAGVAGCSSGGGNGGGNPMEWLKPAADVAIATQGGGGGSGKVNAALVAFAVIQEISKRQAGEQEKEEALAAARERQTEMNAARRAELKRERTKIAVPVARDDDSLPSDQTDVMIYDPESGELASDQVYTIEKPQDGQKVTLDDYRVIYDAG